MIKTPLFFSSSQSAALGEYTSGKPLHSLIIQGPGGCGKRTLAYHLAAYLLCTSPEAKPCYACNACRRVQNESHSNLYTLKDGPDQKSIKIDELRTLLGQLSLHALESGKRVVVIENAARMTPQAQNSLLKSLEEPDEQTHYILTASNMRTLLPTIRSRCCTLNLSPWSEDELLRFLATQNIDKKRASELATLCNGLPGEALAIENNPQFWQIQDLCEQTFFRVRCVADIPAASFALKGAKDDADLILKTLEKKIEALLKPIQQSDQSSNRIQWSASRLNSFLQSVFTARKLQESNVSWQSIVDRLLFNIVEDLYT